MFVNRRSIREYADRIGDRRALRLRRGSQWYHWSLRRPALGIEVRNSALYLACVRPGLGRRWLVGTETIADPALLTRQQLRSKLNDFLARSGAADPLVIVGLPRNEVIVRHLELPLAAESALDEALRLQTALFKPNDDEEYCSDAAVIRDRGGFAASVALLPRNSVETAAGKFAEAGYPPARLTATQFALADLILRGAPAERPAQAIVVHQAGREAELAALRNNALVYSRAISLAAEESAAAQELAAAVREALGILRWTAPQPVVLAGNCSGEAEQALGEAGRVHRLDEWMAGGGLEKPKPSEHWGAIALAVEGLGWLGRYRFNLLPAELRPSRRRWGYAPTYALLATNLLLLGALAARAPVERQILLKQYQREISRLEGPAVQADRELGKERELRQRLGVLGEFEQQGRQPLDLLGAVSSQLPADAWLELYNDQAGQLEVSGSAKSASGVLAALRRLPQVEDVKFNGGITRDDAGLEHFRLQMRFKGNR